MTPRHGFEPGWLGWWDWLFPVLLFGLLVAAGVMLYLSLRRRTATDSDPMRRAARRFADGEMEWVELESIRRDLISSGSDPVRTAAGRLARGEIGVTEFDELRDRLGGEDVEDPETE